MYDHFIITSGTIINLNPKLTGADAKNIPGLNPFQKSICHLNSLYVKISKKPFSYGKQVLLHIQRVRQTMIICNIGMYPIPGEHNHGRPYKEKSYFDYGNGI